MIEQKIRKKVEFTDFQEQQTQTNVTQTLERQFKVHNVKIKSEYILPCEDSASSLGEIPSLKSMKSFKKQIDTHLFSLQKLLVKELTNSLDDIINEIFDEDLDETSKQSNIKCLTILYGILRVEVIYESQYSTILKWIYDMTCINGMELSMQLGNVIQSIKKRLMKLGFSLLRRIKKQKGKVNSNTGDEQEFKQAVSILIQQKQEQISNLKFQLCRVCETYVPLTTIAAHINQCQRIHQLQYLESKLEDRGSKILNKINQLEQHSEQRYNLRMFFDRIYSTFGDVLVTFGLKNQLKEVTGLVEQYKGIQKDEDYTEVIELLENYSKCLEKDVDFGETLSDQDSKQFKSRKKIRVKSIGSNTSLIPSYRTVDQEDLASESQMIGQQILSEKTINTDTQAMIKHNSIKLSDFQVLESIGKGSYSEVYLVRKRNTQDLFAMKVIEIENFNQQRINAFKRQQKIYKSIIGGFNVKLYYSFSLNNLYFLILDFGCGGSLRQLLEQEIFFEQKFAKVYVANLILAVNSIHKMGIIHRDLKPDNIVINDLGELILTDFNLSKLIKDSQNERSNTFFGTPDYIAPEVLRGESKNEMLDYFSVGVIAYQMVIGVTPFTSNSPQEVFENILKGNIDWPEIGNEQGQITEQCQSLLLGLLNPDPKKRLGANGLEELQSHSFFQGVNWSKIEQNQFFYIPSKAPDYEQNYSLLLYIQSKMQNESQKAIEGEIIVRYDILKSITNKNVKSHRNSRFKLEKELSVLKIQPSAHSSRRKKHNSYNKFNNVLDDNFGISCKDFYQETPQQKRVQ